MASGGRRRLCEKAAGEGKGLLLNGWISAEAAEPVDAGLVPEPCHLALGVLASLGLAFEDGVIERKPAGEDLRRLLIAERLERFGVRRKTGLEKALRFLEKPVLKHGSGTLVEAFTEGGSIGRETKFENGEALQAVARGGLNMSRRPAG